MALEFAYAFNNVGSTTVLDLSGNGRNIDLTGTNGAQVSGGQTGGALGKTGATMPTLPTAAVNALKTDDWAIMFDALGIRQTWWFRCWDGTNSGVRGVLDLDGTLMRGQLRTAPGDSLQTRPTAAVPETTSPWRHYALTYKRSTGLLTMYRDGVQVSQVDIADGTQASNNFTIIDMAEWTASGPSIDNVRGLSHCPDDAEVLALSTTPVTAPETASLTASMPKATMAASATVSASANLAGVLPRASMAATASVSASAVLAGIMPKAIADFQLSEQLPATAMLSAVMLKAIGGTGVLAVSEELKLQRMLTKIFIHSSPVSISLVPHIRNHKPSGGVGMVAGTPRPMQVFRLIPMSHTEQPARSTSTAAASDSGKQRRYDYTLLGEWNSDMEENDQWELPDGQTLVIVTMISYNGYERKGLVISYGKDPSHV